jgi:hypothetical protein
MTSSIGRGCRRAVVCLFLVAGFSSPLLAKIPEGYGDVKLGMHKDQVVDVLKQNPSHFSYDDRGSEIGEIVRGDNLFRYVTYRFDKNNKLIEIGLQMREVVGRDEVLKIFNSKHGLQITPHQKTVEGDRSLQVRDNDLVLRLDSSSDTRAAKQADSQVSHTAR